MGKAVRRVGPGKTQGSKGKLLPKWNLADLYSDPSDPKIARTLRRAKKAAEVFRRTYFGKIEKQTRSATQFRKLLSDYENVQLDASKPYHYASLLFAESATVAGRGALLQKAKTEYVQIANLLAFFLPELLSLGKKKLQRLSRIKGLAEYRNYLQQLIEYQKHELPEREKQIFTDLSLSGSGAVGRMFEEEYASRLYALKQGRSVKQVPMTEVLEYLHHPDRKMRKLAHQGFSDGLQEDSRRMTLIFNTLLQDKDIRDRYHHFDSAEDARHLENQLDRPIIDALSRTAKQSYRDVARFYEFKRELLGFKKLYDYDRYAPVVRKSQKIPWPKARELVVDAFTDFHPEFGRIATEFFSKRWIDAQSRPGKRGGAFCSFVTPDLHPYVFVNYSGTERDVFTLAHELGHAIHAYLMREQEFLNFDTPLVIAETASVFSELVLFHSLVSKTRTPEARLGMYIHHIENIIATVHRQMSMFLFERDIHAARKKGELQTEDINQLWRKRQEEMFKGSVTLTPEYDYWWSYIPHFVHTPFYVYAYSFGQLFALGLHEKCLEAPEKFAEQFIQFLKAGNTKSPKELGRIVGASLSGTAIWNNGVRAFRKMVREAERLAAEL